MLWQNYQLNKKKCQRTQTRRFGYSCIILIAKLDKCCVTLMHYNNTITGIGSKIYGSN